MDFIQTSNKSVDLYGSGKHGFSAGNPSLGILATLFSNTWANNVQQELVNAIEGAGLTITPADQTQLKQAIQAMAAGRLINLRVFTSSGTYTPTAGTKSIVVLVQGGGGGGGGCNTTGAGEVAAGAGGGAGGWAIKRITSGFSGVSMTIGGGGSGVAGAAGNSGGTTSFGALVSATGGSGGSVGPNSGTVGTPQGVGSPGLGSGGDLNFRGGLGLYAFYSAGAPTSGWGGSSYFGAGAPWSTSTLSNGINASVLGAGASGAAIGASVNGFSVSGGAGGGGAIVVWEHG